MKYLEGVIKKGKNVYINDRAYLSGSIELGDNVSIWPGASLRGDESYIKIGDNSNVQDNVTVHCGRDNPVVIGSGVTVGHNAIIHGCEIADNVIVGMGATVLDGAKVGSGCIIGACALITGGKVIPENSIVVGNPYKILRESSKKDLEYIKNNALEYVHTASEYAKRRI